MKNKKIEVIPLPDNISVEQYTNVLQLIKQIGNENEMKTSIDLDEKENELFEMLVREIRNGNTISIYSSDEESSLTGKDYFEVSPPKLLPELEKTRVVMTHDMIQNPNFLNPGLYNTPITGTIQIANLKKDINIELKS